MKSTKNKLPFHTQNSANRKSGEIVEIAKRMSHWVSVGLPEFADILTIASDSISFKDARKQNSKLIKELFVDFIGII